ncbi:ANTAR domain-containing protein [Modestobacter muralis]|uniref:ANTAR domain-containing protein n=1 Tax=Modestobacter muralis TaxID=1608614 RepID=A0A6P0F1Z4_9ACTN|nr:ANTAR domain-containing protein [Modestobacter muralis]NEK96124.1 ANTAR domain-containing protein [Modestobacter muralis]NEN53012.1 ANTAR domain-containing protein [Modestobacter muralis]
MDIAGRFMVELARVSTGATDPRLLPDRLATATARALGVDAVGLTLAAQRPTSIGASGETAQLAEQLQFTVGSGPCLATVDSQTPVFAVESHLQRRWPFYHDLLHGQTPFRSVVAFPMNGGLSRVGAMVIYLTSPAGPLEFDALDAQSLVSLVSEELGASTAWAGPHQPGLQHWIDVPAARVRTTVWQAVGMVTEGLSLSGADALALLRARAYSTSRLVDEVAHDLVTDHLSVDELLADTPR